MRCFLHGTSYKNVFDHHILLALMRCPHGRCNNIIVLVCKNACSSPHGSKKHHRTQKDRPDAQRSVNVRGIISVSDRPPYYIRIQIGISTLKSRALRLAARNVVESEIGHCAVVDRVRLHLHRLACIGRGGAASSGVRENTSTWSLRSYSYRDRADTRAPPHTRTNNQFEQQLE